MRWSQSVEGLSSTGPTPSSFRLQTIHKGIWGVKKKCVFTFYGRLSSKIFGSSTPSPSFLPSKPPNFAPGHHLLVDRLQETQFYTDFLFTQIYKQFYCFKTGWRSQQKRVWDSFLLSTFMDQSFKELRVWCFINILLYFHQLVPLGRVGLVVAKSVCLCVCVSMQNTALSFTERSGQWGATSSDH